jgi:L-threonylcarbamoyladenylate synthase
MEIIKNNDLAIKKICEVLSGGGAIICPTDTVYGLIADATNKEAVEKIIKIKKRDNAKAISVFVKDIEKIEKIAFVDEKQKYFLKNNLPGKWTVILKRKPNCGLAENLFGGKNTIGIRVIENEFINSILEKTKKILTATSANISGQPASGKIKEILEQFEGQEAQPDLVVDAGDLTESFPSKIVDLTKNKPKILRL